MAAGFPDRVAVDPLLVDWSRWAVWAGSPVPASGSTIATGRPGRDPAFEPVLAVIAIASPTARPARMRSSTGSSCPMLLEAIRVVDEGIVRDPADLDLGVVLGLGFPASRGGILAWCDSEGAGAIMDRLARYSLSAPRFTRPLRFLGWPGRRARFMHRHLPRPPSRCPSGLSPEPAGPGWRSMVMIIARVHIRSCEPELGGFEAGISRRSLVHLAIRQGRSEFSTSVITSHVRQA